MKPKLILCLALVLSGSLLLMITGCHGMGTQSFTAFPPAQSSELESSSQTVLDVTCTGIWKRADYSMWENVSMLAPQPKQWKYDLTLQVERVIKGKFNEKTLEIHGLREPTSEQRSLLGVSSSWPFGMTNSTPLRISFDGRSGKRFTNLEIITRP